MPRLAKVVRIHPDTVTAYSAGRARHPTARRPVDPATVAPTVWAAAMRYAAGDPARVVRLSWGHVVVAPPGGRLLRGTDG